MLWRLPSSACSDFDAANALARSQDSGRRLLCRWLKCTTGNKSFRLIERFTSSTTVSGAAQIPVENFNEKTRDLAMRHSKPGSYDLAKAVAEMVQEGCVDKSLQKRLSSNTASGFVFVDYVNYILTTANTWKTPIKDFELVIDYSNPWSLDPVLPSFCWDGPVERVDATHFSVKQRDLTPKKEFVVYFFRR
jgi:hypothetical protein